MVGLKSGFKHPALTPRDSGNRYVVQQGIDVAIRALGKSKNEVKDEATGLNNPQPYLSFRDYIKKANPKFVFFKHCEKLIAVLQDVVDGKKKRVMVFEPPRHGKSELSTRLLTGYFLYRYPQRWVSINSYGANLAYGLSRHAREYFKGMGGECKGDSDAVEQWETTDKGGVFAAGVGGPILGKGWHLGLIDDCLKNAEEANSSVIREKQKEWLETTFMTREEPWTNEDPDGAIVITMQRWHEDDVCGYLLQQEREAIDDEEDTEKWHIVFFEAIKTNAKPNFPASCTVEPDWREEGEALCPERRPLHKLLKLKNRLERSGKGRYWEALFQQSPVPAEGNIVKMDWIKYYSVMPANPTRIIQSWDTALKEKDLSDFSVCTTWYVTDNAYYLVDVFRKQIGSPELIRTAINLGEKWKPHLILIEDKGSGTGLIQHLREKTSLSVLEVEPKGEKMMRFETESDAFAAGKVFIPEVAEWQYDYKKEITDAPNGTNDDQCDSTSQFLNHVRLNCVKRGASLF
jgi:predicted phage terminase large subunit-like protein